MELVGDGVAGYSALEITAEEEDGEISGDILFTDSDSDDSWAGVTVECADTETAGVVILSGEITSTSDSADTENDLFPGARQFFVPQITLFIREGDPDSVAVLLEEGLDRSCNEVLADPPNDVPDDIFVDVEEDDDIETG